MFNLVTALSLLMCVAVVVIVTYSFWRAHYFYWSGRAAAGTTLTETVWNVYVAWGAIKVEHRSGVTVYPSPEGPEHVVRRLGTRGPSSHQSHRAAARRERFGTVWERLGFVWDRVSLTYPASNYDGDGERRPIGRSIDEWEITVPTWPLALLCVLPPAFWCLRLGRRVKARRNMDRNLCPACGYDLRASEGRCPECGEKSPAAIVR